MIAPPPLIDQTTAYAIDIIEGRIVVGKWVRMAAERHMRDLKNPRLIFDVAEAERRIAFCPNLRHYKGAFKGKPFHPEPWEKFIIGSVFGWKLKESGRRRFRYALIKIARKNGKTFLAAAIAIMMLIAGGNLKPDGTFEAEAGAEVYFVATKEDQAKIGWKDCARIIKRSPGLSDLIRSRVKELRYDEADAVCVPLGSDSDTLDGLNPSCAVKDEFHAWEDRNLHDVIEDAYGARDQPLDFIITTEGTVREGICDELTGHCKNILESDGSYADDSFFAALYELDDADDPFDEKVWFKANPNLGISKSLDYMRDQAAKARLMPGKYSTFLTKQLNRRTNAEERWLSIDLWDACKGPVDAARLEKKLCYCGLDLARSRDMSALGMVFPDAAGGYDVLMRYWIPEDTLEERVKRDRVPYDVWVREGYITVTGGNVTDFNQIEADISALSKKYQIHELAYDPTYATDLAIRLRDNHGMNPVEFLQTFKNYAMPCEEMERILMGTRMRHGAHPVLRWNAGNVVVRIGPSGHKLPDKAKSKLRIDGMIATLMGLGRCLTTEGPQGSIYETRGVFST